MKEMIEYEKTSIRSMIDYKVKLSKLLSICPFIATVKITVEILKNKQVKSNL